MHHIKFLFTFTAGLLILLAAGAGCSQAERPANETTAKDEASSAGIWMTDYQGALELAAESDRTVLLYFTGSDWCGPCMHLKQQVFSKNEFKEFAQENLVLVELDFPLKKRLPQALMDQNERLQERFGVQGFPVILLLDQEEKVLARTTYSGQSLSAFIDWLREKTDKA